MRVSVEVRTTPELNNTTGARKARYYKREKTGTHRIISKILNGQENERFGLKFQPKCSFSCPFKIFQDYSMSANFLPFIGENNDNYKQATIPD